MSKEQKKLIITIIIVVIGLGIMSYLCYDATIKRDIAQKALLAEEGRLADIKSKIRQIPRLEAEIDQLKGKISFYERTLPSAKEAEETLKLLQRLLVQTNITIASLAPSTSGGSRRRGAKRKAGPYTRHEFKLKISGNYHQLGRFISGLEHMKRFTTIESMSIKSGSGDILSVDLVVVTYSFKGGKV